MVNPADDTPSPGKRSLLMAATLGALAGPLPLALAGGTCVQADSGATPGGMPMKHYKSTQWGFELDIPESWNVFPGASNVTPYSMVSFQSNEDGQHRLGVLRQPHDPKIDETAQFDKVQAGLLKLDVSGRIGVSGITRSTIGIGGRRAMTVDFDMALQEGRVVHARQYYIIDGALLYMLNATTDRPGTLMGLFDQMARSFAHGRASGM